MKTRLFLTVISMIFLSTMPTILAVDESDVSIWDLKNVYKIGEIMDFSLEYPSFCGENKFAVEDVNSNKRIWEGVVNIGCEPKNNFLDRKELQQFTTERPRPGGLGVYADPIITSYEGTFRFVYEAGDIRKEWTYQVFEKIPLHLDSEALMRLAILVAFYIVFPLVLYKKELVKKFRK